MKNKTSNTAPVPRPTPAVRPPGDPESLVFSPDPDEVARRAYFTFLNQGSPMGHDVQHWLTAEAEMISERNQTRVHGYHNPT